MDALARNFNKAHDMSVKDEIYRLAAEHVKPTAGYLCHVAVRQLVEAGETIFPL